jgi:hypothetical protein
MANATSRVRKGALRWTDEFAKRSTKTLAAETTFYTGAMVGVTTGGYLAKLDDTESLIFAGLVRGQEGDPVLPIATAGDDRLGLDIHKPPAFELAIASIAVTDIGKKVYALDDQTGTLSASAATFDNLIGVVVDVVASGIALVAPVYDGIAANLRLGAVRQMAATGAQSLSKWDLNKTILVPNTAAYSITLPAVADTQAGDRLFFAKTTSDAFAATLDGNASETIDGATTLATIDAQYDCATLVSTGAAWIVLSRDIT